MTTDWSKVEFASTASTSRKAQDLLPVLSDVLVVWDFLACGISGLAALSLYAHLCLPKPLDFLASGPFWRDIVFGSLITALVSRDAGGLFRWRAATAWRFCMKAEWRCLLSFGVLIAVGLATRATNDLARLWLACWLLMVVALVAISRMGIMRYLKRLESRGELRETIAIVGSAQSRDRLASRIASDARIVRRYAAWPEDEGHGEDLDDLLELGRNGGVDSVIVALDQDEDIELPYMIEQLKALPVQVAVCRDVGWSIPMSPQMRFLGGVAMAVVADRPLKRWGLVAKTLFDKLGAGLLLIALTPLMVAIALAVGLTSPGPIIFRQHRQGWSGKTFVVFKFRTMRHESTAAKSMFQTLRYDARCTWVGRKLRSSSLDELPQLWNVLRGEMSLVGPRPHADSLHDLDRAGREIVAEYAQRNRVKPGITGWAQVHGARGATATLDQLRRRVDYDLYYIDNWSIWLDIQILLRTPFSMIGGNAF